MRRTGGNSSINDQTKTYLKAVTKAVYLADMRAVLKGFFILGLVPVYFAGLVAVLKVV